MKRLALPIITVLAFGCDSKESARESSSVAAAAVKTPSSAPPYDFEECDAATSAVGWLLFNNQVDAGKKAVAKLKKAHPECYGEKFTAEQCLLIAENIKQDVERPMRMLYRTALLLGANPECYTPPPRPVTVQDKRTGKAACEAAAKRIVEWNTRHPNQRPRMGPNCNAIFGV